MANNNHSDAFIWADVEAAMADIRLMARRLLAQKSNQYSWRPTALLDEALMRLYARGGRWSEITWENREHFFHACCRAMHCALLDRHRYHQAASRPQVVPIESFLPTLASSRMEQLVDQQPDIFALFAQACMDIRREHPDLADVLERRFILGLSLPQIALIIGYSERHTRRLWVKAIAQLEYTANELNE